jgi:nitrogen-specific signal transduction histidine kinase
VRDITLRHDALCALTDANERLQAHDRARLDFVSNVSHELRTPLTSMIYAVGNMLRGVVGPMPEKAVVYLERLESDCQRLLATVNDILDLRQIENQNLVLTKQVVPLGAVIRDGVDPVQIQADSKHIEIKFDMLTRELFCLCDAQKMERVVLNIVGNAIKFTPANGTITLTLRQSPNNLSMALLSVCDTGMGVPPEMLPKLSQRYFRTGDHVSGTGLGLAISREIVELHEGTMSFASPVPGTICGTAVYVELPLAPIPVVAAVSQDTETSDFLKQQIPDLGYALDFRTNAQRTLTACTEQPPALLMVDARITDMNVRDFVMQLRENPKTKRLPIIVFGETAISRADVELYRHFGIFYVTLPWNEPDLRNALAMAVRGKLR